jgi:hypothetical protein
MEEKAMGKKAPGEKALGEKAPEVRPTIARRSNAGNPTPSLRKFRRNDWQ